MPISFVMQIHHTCKNLGKCVLDYVFAPHSSTAMFACTDSILQIPQIGELKYEEGAGLPAWAGGVCAAASRAPRNG